MGEKVVPDNRDEQKAGVGGDDVQPKKDDGGAITVVLKVDLHCEGCAKKVRRCIKHFDGVEGVTEDLAGNKVTVVGKVDPIQVQERLAAKIKKKVELVSPEPSKKEASGGEKKADEKKPVELPVITVVLSARIHCDGCARKIKKIIRKYRGVQDVNVDLHKDLITVKGTMNTKELLPYLNTKLKRTVEVAPPPKKDGGAPAPAPAENKPKQDGGEKKEKEAAGGEKKEKEGGGDKNKEEKKEKEGGGDKNKEEKKDKEGDGEKKGEEKAAVDGGKSTGDDIIAPTVVVSKMQYYGNPYAYDSYTYDPSSSYSNGSVVEYSQPPYMLQTVYAAHPGESVHGSGYSAVPYGHDHGYMDHQQAPTMFSDENPNAACSIM